MARLPNHDRDRNGCLARDFCPMIQRNSPKRRSLTVLMVVVSILPVACSQERGPESFRTTAISGRLSMGGRSLGPGWLEIMPVDGTTGLLRSARVERGGTFRADRVPVGLVAMRMVGFPDFRTGVPTYDVFLRDVRQVYLIRRKIAPEGGELPLELAPDAQEHRANAP